MTVQIHPATRADLQAIGRVHVESWRETYLGIVPDAFLAQLDPAQRAAMWGRYLDRLPERGRHMVVAELDGEVVGFAGTAAAPDDGPDTAELLVLYLLRRAQGQGTGRRLMADIAALLAADGFRHLSLWVLADNPTRGFYEHLGGRPAEDKHVEIGDTALTEIAYVWDDLTTLTSPGVPS